MTSRSNSRSRTVAVRPCPAPLWMNPYFHFLMITAKQRKSKLKCKEKRGLNGIFEKICKERHHIMRSLSLSHSSTKGGPDGDEKKTPTRKTSKMKSKINKWKTICVRRAGENNCVEPHEKKRWNHAIPNHLPKQKCAEQMKVAASRNTE